MFVFTLSAQSGVPTYLQLMQQVRNGIRMGTLRPGDRLPTAKMVVSDLSVNPNTVLKAYRELERDGLVKPRPGAGTFVQHDLGSVSAETRDRLFADLQQWMSDAAKAGLDEDDIAALFAAARSPALRNAG